MASTATNPYASSGCASIGIPAGSRLVRLEGLTDLPGTFVEFPLANATVHAIDDAVGVRVLTGTDGTTFGDSLVTLATGRPSRPVEVSPGVVRLVENNPFEVPSAYERSSCDAGDHRYGDSFVAPIVDPPPAYVEVTILPLGRPQNSSRILRVMNTQSTYCDQAGQTRTAPAGYQVYNLGSAADLSQAPILKRRDGAGPGTNLSHWLTAADVPAIPALTLDNRSTFDGSGTPVVLSALGGEPVAIPAAAVPLPWETYFTDSRCTAPAAAEPPFAAGSLLARVENPELGAGACREALRAAPWPLASLWRVDAGAATTGQPFYLWSGGAGEPRCLSRGESMGGPPPQPIAYRPTTDVTGQAPTLLPSITVSEP